MPQHAKVDIRPNGSIEIEAPFNAAFVSALKAAIPAVSREFMPDVACTDITHNGCKGRWILKPLERDKAVTILRNFYSEVRVVRPGTSTKIFVWPGTDTGSVQQNRP